MRFLISSSFVFLMVSTLACQGASVAAYAPCGPMDTCPSSMCEASFAQGPTFCTKSCTSDKDCPNDGICSAAVGPTSTAAPFCYETCPDNGCASGSCVSLVATDTSIVSVCLPGITSTLAATTTWTSATIAPQAMNKGVATSTYAITLTGGAFDADAITVTGMFSATLTQTFMASSSYVYGGCTETTTFTGGTWSAVSQPTPDMGRFTVISAIGTTNRAGCMNAMQNATNLQNLYDSAVNTGVGDPFTIQTNMLTIDGGGGGGGLPYGDKVDWSFTKM